MSFARAVANVLKNEGGYVDNPKDPGGETAFGISARAYPNLNIKTLTQQQAAEIYSRDYWDPIKGDELPDSVSFALLDFAVNSGVATSVRCLQRAVNVSVDGVLGPQTIAACKNPGVVTALSVERIYFMTKLSGWANFGKGWTTRVINTAIGAFQ